MILNEKNGTTKSNKKETEDRSQETDGRGYWRMDNGERTVACHCEEVIRQMADE